MSVEESGWSGAVGGTGAEVVRREAAEDSARKEAEAVMARAGDKEADGASANAAGGVGD